MLDNEEKSKKLFKVTLQGLSSSTNISFHESYVIAKNPDEAYKKVRKWLDENNYGFKDEREMDTIELIADEYKYNNIRVPLFL